MAIPSGSGTEVIKRVALESVNGNSAAVNLTCPADHILIVTTIHVTENGNAAELLTIYKGGNSVDCRLTRKVALPAYGTYIHDSKFAMHPADTLIVYADSSSVLDIHITYIDQDWS